MASTDAPKGTTWPHHLAAPPAPVHADHAAARGGQTNISADQVGFWKKALPCAAKDVQTTAVQNLQLVGPLPKRRAVRQTTAVWFSR